MNAIIQTILHVHPLETRPFLLPSNGAGYRLVSNIIQYISCNLSAHIYAHIIIITKSKAMNDEDYPLELRYTDGGTVKESMGSKTSTHSS